MLVTDIAAVDRRPTYRDHAKALGFLTVAGIPVRLQDFRLGAINLYEREVEAWAEDDVAAAQALADMASSLVVINAEALEQSPSSSSTPWTVGSSSSRRRVRWDGERGISVDEASCTTRPVGPRPLCRLERFSARRSAPE